MSTPSLQPEPSEFRIREFYRRIELFLGLVWRLDPAYPDDDPTRITIAKAWDVAGILHPWRNLGKENMTKAPTIKAERNRVSMVMEIAMRQRFKERRVTDILPKPSIDELEKMLNENDPPNIEIMPDGSVIKTEDIPIFMSDLADAAIAALYADGFVIVPRDKAKE